MKRFWTWAFALMFFCLILGLIGALGIFYYYGKDLPDHSQLAEYEPGVVTRIYAGDGRLVEEYARENRIFAPYEDIPKRLVYAYLSAEDSNFFQHFGVDPKGIARAMIHNVPKILNGSRPEGASTITQQVSRGFMLSNELSYARKIKEMILALKVERALSKERILELYLNEIFLGYRSYGVASAALNYFNKSLDELSLAEMAYLASLPKAPSNYHPIYKREAAIARRNWVLERLLIDGRITRQEATTAQAEPLVVQTRSAEERVEAAYFAEEVRRQIIEQYGEDVLYSGGLSVRTTVDPDLQSLADASLRAGLIAYDRRHGWRGPLATVSVEQDGWEEGGWQTVLQDQSMPLDTLEDWQKAVVLALDGEAANIGLSDGTTGTIPMAELRWARANLENQRFGHKPSRPSDVLAAGDIILVEALSEDENGAPYEDATYGLRQIPDVNGGLVAMDPHTGRVLAMSGGFSFKGSSFNRATQAKRQPGSSFKPFIYMAALDSGFTPATIVVDGPVAVNQGPGLPTWKPHNYSQKFYGPTPLRIGIEKSRNLMTVRIAQRVGMEKIVDYARRFGVVENLEPYISMSLGAGETTVMDMTTGYSQIVNGGKKITPSLIDRVQNRYGKTIYQHDRRSCEACESAIWAGQDVPTLPDTREQIVDPATAYQMVSIMQGVVERGTGVRLRSIGKPLAGKTGTTNNYQDAWFVGFSPDFALGVYVGFDEPRTLGRSETGSSVAIPIWKAFMEQALADKPATPFRVPRSVRFVRIDRDTGLPPRDGAQTIILEAFKPGTEPQPGAYDNNSAAGGFSNSGGGSFTPNPGKIY